MLQPQTEYETIDGEPLSLPAFAPKVTSATKPTLLFFIFSRRRKQGNQYDSDKFVPQSKPPPIASALQDGTHHSCLSLVRLVRLKADRELELWLRKFPPLKRELVPTEIFLCFKAAKEQIT